MPKIVEPRTKLAQFIQAETERRGARIIQNDLAAATGCSYQHLSEVIRGKHLPSQMLKVAIRASLERILGRPIEEDELWGEL